MSTTTEVTCPDCGHAWSSRWSREQGGLWFDHVCQECGSEDGEMSR